MKVDIVETLRQPEYTGENRCEPCTVLNLIIAGIASSAIARKSKLGGAAAFGASVGLIYLRGYLVPGTPKLTKQYLPPTVLRWFGKEPKLETRGGFSDRLGETTSTDEQTSKTVAPDSEIPREEIDPHDFLLAEGVLEGCEDRDDLCLSESFSKRWDTEMNKLAEKNLDASEAISILGFKMDSEAFEIEQYGVASTLVADSQTIGHWPSQGALLADIAAAHILDGRSVQWNKFVPAKRGQILNGLRLFLEYCPSCKESASINQETVESCCSSHEVITVSCDGTGERLFEQPV